MRHGRVRWVLAGVGAAWSLAGCPPRSPTGSDVVVVIPRPPQLGLYQVDGPFQTGCGSVEIHLAFTGTQLPANSTLSNVSLELLQISPAGGPAVAVQNDCPPGSPGGTDVLDGGVPIYRVCLSGLTPPPLRNQVLPAQYQLRMDAMTDSAPIHQTVVFSMVGCEDAGP